MAASVRDAVSRGGAQTRARVDSVISAVVAFSILIGIVAAFVGYYVTAYLVEAGERQKLAMFVEKNPNPVLRLAPGGEGAVRQPRCRRDAAQSRTSRRPAEQPAAVGHRRARACARAGSRGGGPLRVRDLRSDLAMRAAPPARTRRVPLLPGRRHRAQAGGGAHAPPGVPRCADRVAEPQAAAGVDRRPGAGAAGGGDAGELRPLPPVAHRRGPGRRRRAAAARGCAPRASLSRPRPRRRACIVSRATPSRCW